MNGIVLTSRYLCDVATKWARRVSFTIDYWIFIDLLAQILSISTMAAQDGLVAIDQEVDKHLL